MAMFTITMVHGPHWDSSRQRREQAAWAAHAAYMDQLVDDDFVVLGGPLGDGAMVLLAVEAKDESEIRARFDQDPWIPMGVIQIATIAPRTIWLDGRSSAASSEPAVRGIPEVHRPE
jgi:uncharacterized protein YciI